MQQLERFYSQDINIQHEGGPLQESTLNKMVERISALMQLRSLPRQLESQAQKECLFKHAAKPLAEQKIVYRRDPQALPRAEVASPRVYWLGTS